MVEISKPNGTWRRCVFSCNRITIRLRLSDYLWMVLSAGSGSWIICFLGYVLPAHYCIVSRSVYEEYTILTRVIKLEYSRRI